MNFFRLLAKGQEGEGQQLLVLQVPSNDNDGDDTQTSCHQITAYNPNLDHQYHNDENQAVFLSSNSIPVTTCVTVSTDDQVLEVQLEHNQERDISELEEVRASDAEQELIDDESDQQLRGDDETNEAVSTIPAEEKDWKIYSQELVVSNSYQNKRKNDFNEESEDNAKSEE